MARLDFPLPLSESPDEIDMASAQELTTDLKVLEERVKNHIRFFWAAVAVGFGWLAVISGLLYQTKTAVNQIAQVEANTPPQIVASLLNNPATTPSEAQANLAAAASVLQSTKVGKVKPDSAKLRQISDKLSEDQSQYPDLPQVWKTTGAFINYKSEVLLSNAPQVFRTASGHACTETMQRAGWVFENCEISLENVASHIKGNKLDGNSTPFIFKHCVVDYHGGTLPDGPITFENTVFRFSVDIVPPRRGAKTMLLLTQAENPILIQVPSA